MSIIFFISFLFIICLYTFTTWFPTIVSEVVWNPNNKPLNVFGTLNLLPSTPISINTRKRKFRKLNPKKRTLQKPKPQRTMSSRSKHIHYLQVKRWKNKRRLVLRLEIWSSLSWIQENIRFFNTWKH